MKYDKQYFIKKFSAIPDELWMTGVPHSEGKCCALGHCGYRIEAMHTEESQALMDLFGGFFEITGVNDNSFCGSEDKRRTEETPKARVIAALKEMI